MTRNGYSTTFPSNQVCRHFNTSKGCYRGDSCRYAHVSPGGTTNTPQSVRMFDTPCRYFALGNCKRGDSCFYKHVTPDGNRVADHSSNATSAPASSKTTAVEEYPCLICFEEKPSRYGLLPGCSHSFCMDCIRSWRDVSDKDLSIVSSGAIKTCPVCRAPSSFVVPSPRFYPESNPKKKTTIEEYKERLSRIPCKYLMKSITLGRSPWCPFGRDCFFRHCIDGEKFTFTHGTNEMEAAQRRRRARMALAEDFARFQEAFFPMADDWLESNFETLIASIRDEDEELAYNGTESGYEDEEEEDEDEEDWEAEEDEDFRRIFEQQWLSERFARLMIDTDEDSRDSPNNWEIRIPRFIPASHLRR